MHPVFVQNGTNNSWHLWKYNNFGKIGILILSIRVDLWANNGDTL